MKKTLSILLAVALTAGLAGCGAKQTSPASGTPTSTGSSEKKIIKVGASPVPHKEILEVVKPLLEKKGYKLEITEFTDYVQPNLAVNDGQLDANFFQHVPYLQNMVKEKNLSLDYTVKVHLEPMGVYSKKVKAITELKDGASIAVPNDPTNEARALRVLENAGLIKLKSGDLVTAIDITENPKNLKFKELEAAQLPRTLDDVDAAVINGNYALEAKLNPSKDALAIEAKDSPFANILAVKKSDKDKDYIKALSEALTSPEVKQFLQNKYTDGSVIPAF
ncbi:MetQ/NlpA family ABC transporter substrate-binding protein [Clostridium swellfunianum]|uniref:MetQ/NlpA family ABC transporter substrate-binding protein n=1 Tax=Clostridium swellfunianum TaxID=1367462 RepID=UPI00202E8B3F|nr:MetQ/NlpA family ABC transporter substrate-binding protein [Clostridium swellfunianum]MCM0650656.1 MetQ/NlpA family ABC transporter substrate-binding protein [Clostridium swellfunianum]